jgi:hypothetical protein
MLFLNMVCLTVALAFLAAAHNRLTRSARSLSKSAEKVRGVRRGVAKGVEDGQRLLTLWAVSGVRAWPWRVLVIL